MAIISKERAADFSLPSVCVHASSAIDELWYDDAKRVVAKKRGAYHLGEREKGIRARRVRVAKERLHARRFFPPPKRDGQAFAESAASAVDVAHRGPRPQMLR